MGKKNRKVRVNTRKRIEPLDAIEGKGAATKKEEGGSNIQRRKKENRPNLTPSRLTPKRGWSSRRRMHKPRRSRLQKAGPRGNTEVLAERKKRS